jgi:hypothetical protein
MSVSWLLVIVALIGLSLVVAAALTALAASWPHPENRPAPQRTAGEDAARLEALKRIYARHQGSV